MTLPELRKNEDLTAWWAKTYNSTRFGVILQMLHDTHPLRFTDDRTRFSTSASDHRLGMLEGYELVLERLRLATQYETETAQVPEASFEPVMPDRIE